MSQSKDLLSKFLCQMTGEEFLQLNELRASDHQTSMPTSHSYAQGVSDLAEKIGCCQSTIYALKKLGVLEDAIVSQIGRRIVFDVEKARILADDYQRTQRKERHADRG